MNFCTNCGKQVRQDASFCVSCGVQQKTKTDERFCIQCGKQIKAENAFCVSCGAQQQSVTTEEKITSLNSMSQKSIFTGVSAIALIILLLQRTMSIPAMGMAGAGVQGFFGINLGALGIPLMGWFSFYELMNASRLVSRLTGEPEIVIFPAILFLLSVISICFLVVYILFLVKKWEKAQLFGKLGFLLTFVLAGLVLCIVISINGFMTHYVGIRFMQLRWLFYIMIILAGVGFFAGFKPSREGTNMIRVASILKILLFGYLLLRVVPEFRWTFRAPGLGDSIFVILFIVSVVFMVVLGILGILKCKEFDKAEWLLKLSTIATAILIFTVIFGMIAFIISVGISFFAMFPTILVTILVCSIIPVVYLVGALRNKRIHQGLR